MNKQLKVWRGETDTVIAYDLADVAQVLLGFYGGTMEDGDDVPCMMEHEWRVVTGPISIWDGDTDKTETKDAREWIADEGRGWLSSTEY